MAAWVELRGVEVTAKEVARLSGVNYNTLLFWLRKGWVSTSVYPREKWGRIDFSRADLKGVRALAAIRRRHEREWRGATRGG